jgi:hypothetical protein
VKAAEGFSLESFSGRQKFGCFAALFEKAVFGATRSDREAGFTLKMRLRMPGGFA